jgi:hypothetical protein
VTRALALFLLALIVLPAALAAKPKPTPTPRPRPTPTPKPRPPTCPRDASLGRIAYTRSGALHVLELERCRDRVLVAHCHHDCRP